MMLHWGYDNNRLGGKQPNYLLLLHKTTPYLCTKIGGTLVEKAIGFAMQGLRGVACCRPILR